MVKVHEFVQRMLTSPFSSSCDRPPWSIVTNAEEKLSERWCSHRLKYSSDDGGLLSSRSPLSRRGGGQRARRRCAMMRKTAEADLGAVRYLAKPAGMPGDEMLRWFILLAALLLDPAAVLLVAAATRRPESLLART
jgi:hypothetical protein